jgi:hypothetical protein
MYDLAPLTQEIEKLLATEQTVDVVELRLLTNQLEFAWLRTIDEYARSEEWVEEGFAVAASALRAKCGLTQGGANASLKLASKLRQLSVVSEAFASGQISRQHAAVVAEAYTAERAGAISELEEAIVDAAKLATAKELGQIVQRITDALDGDDGAATANEKHARRRLHMSEMLDGMVRFDGLLDHELGQRLRAQVNAMARTLRDQDPGRTPAQVRADALVELAEIGTARADVGAGRETITDVAIRVDLSDIEARRGAELATEIRQHPGKLPKATLQRLTCDCRISRVITDGPSEVLDIGRASRNPTAAQFRALVARDKGCSWPGCDRPPGWCQAHHIRHWLDGGSTNLDNLRLLCRFHHRTVHEGGKDPPLR